MQYELPARFARIDLGFTMKFTFMIDLSQLKPHTKASLSHLSAACPSLFKKRLLAMGFIKGAAIQVIRIAPLSCPIEIDIDGYRMSLRKTEASYIFITIDPSYDS